MKQADQLIERILFLEGLPNLQQLNKLKIGEHTEEMINCDLEVQLQQASLMRESIALSESESDFVTRDLLVEILEYEEEYIDWLETQQHLIQQTGIQNYQQSQISDD